MFNSIEHYGLDITRAAFCGGQPPWRYIDHLDASSSSLPRGDVALRSTMVWRRPHWYPATTETDDGQLRFAFDGDAVLFSDEAERVFKREGLDAFAASEMPRERPLMGGP